VLALAAAPALGDVVFLKGGGKVTGAIVKETEAEVTVDIGAGTLTVPKSSVVRVDKGVSPLQEYRARAASLAPGDVEGWKKLGRWAAGEGLMTQAREAFTHVKAIVPDDPEANRALGLVLLDGHWVTEKESFTARGFVEFEGEWMMPAERQAILEERRASEAARQQELAAQIQAGEAERAVQETREAADQYWAGYGYGYGYGPVYWPALPGRAPPRASHLPARGGGRR
jgi:hypothetical protein